MREYIFPATMERRLESAMPTGTASSFNWGRREWLDAGWREIRNVAAPMDGYRATKYNIEVDDGEFVCAVAVAPRPWRSVDRPCSMARRSRAGTGGTSGDWIARMKRLCIILFLLAATLATAASFQQRWRLVAGQQVATSATVSPWYLSGGISSSDVVAAYQAKGAVSLVASYSNLNDATTHPLALGTAPAWNSSTGWSFNGSSSQLRTDIVAGSTNSCIVRFENGSFSDNPVGIFGFTDNAVGGFQYWPTWSSWRIEHGASLGNAIAMTNGVIALCPDGLWINGVKVGVAFASNWGGVTPLVSYIGSFNNAGLGGTGYWQGDIVAIAFFSRQLTTNEVQAITAAMQDL